VSRSADPRRTPPPAAPAAPAPVPLLGVDFTCAPSRRKPITVARGERMGGVVRLAAIDELASLAEFEALLARPGPWFGAFDFPFGLPREFVDALGLGADCDAVIAALRARCAGRMDFRALVDAWGNGRPPGRRLVHRATDTAQAVASSSPLQTRYVPVGFMYFEGLARLVAAGLALPGLRRGDPQRVAVEGYPGRLAHAVLGRRSYKNDASAERLLARKDLIEALERGRTGTPSLGLRLRLSHAQRDAIVDDTGGDRIDAVLCLLQAAWAQAQPGHGVPPHTDPVEGWIVGP
jgi:hypothetical protein